MPIRKDGNGVIQYTPRSERFDSGVPEGTGVHPADSFAVADNVDQLKQVQFDPSPQGTNSTVVFRSGATASNSTVVLTLPAVDTTLGGGGSPAFTTIQTPAGTSPVATGEDTLTLTSTDSSVTITGNSSTDTVNFATRYSNPVATDAEAFGSGATCSISSVAIGKNANTGAAGSNSVAIGAGAQAGHGGIANQANVAVGALVITAASSPFEYNTAIGYNVLCAGGDNVRIGAWGGTMTGSRQIAIGSQTQTTSYNDAIVLGAFGTATASNQCLIGSNTSHINDVYLGRGVVHTVPGDLRLRATGGSGADVAGGKLILCGAISTGAAPPGVVQLQTSTAGSSGSTAQTLSTRLEVDGTGRVTKQIGSSSSYAPVGGTANVNTTAVGNVGAGEDDLMTYSLPASALIANGDHVEIDAWGTYAANANNKTVKLYFGATAVFDSGALSVSGGAWRVRATVVRTGATAQIAVSSNHNSTQTASPAETLSGAVTIKCTGEATADNDIQQLGMIVRYHQV